MLNETTEDTQPTIGEFHLEARRRLTDRHQHLLETVLKENLHKEKYWILGSAKIKRKNGKTTIRPVLKAFYYQPEVQKQSYLYEVDNTAGTRDLIWVMHPNGKLDMPVIGKSISVAAESA
jgi:hypothetical protein